MLDNASVRHQVFASFGVMALVLVILAGLIGVMFAWQVGVSFGWGGAISLIPSLMFGWLYFRWAGVQAVHKIMAAFYQAEVMKLGLTAILFGLTFVWLPVNGLALFVGFVVAQVLFFILMPFFLRQF